MVNPKINKKESTAIINSLGGGVVPRIGLEHIAVGREREINAVLQDLENIADGAAAFRFIIGRYGSGKSFILQLIRNHAMAQGFVVADADLSPERRLTGSNGQGVATYRELMRNIATKTNPDGGALKLILERWISNIMTEVAKDTGLRPKDNGFDDQVESKILEVVKDIEGLVHGFDFATVVTAYWRGHREDNEEKKDLALRWLRGEFATKTEAKSALGVRVIIEDNTWYDYIKLFAKFISDIGYKGLLVLLDEAVYLYNISHKGSRDNNYEKLLALFNDAMQGKAEYLGILMGGTPTFLEDSKRGLYSYEALYTRLKAGRTAKKGLQDMSAPVIRLEPLTPENILELLQRLTDVHAAHYKNKKTLTPAQLQQFMQEVTSRLGAKELLTPREVVRDFIEVLNLLQQNPEISFSQLIHSFDFKPTAPDTDPSVDVTSEFAEFTL